MTGIHFISGLPRSGSTLLSAILSQNPRFHASMSSPLSIIVASLLANMSGANEFAMFMDHKQKMNILAGVFENYYAGQHKQVVFDTNRFWCSKLPMLGALFPGAKVIACVRNVSEIINSIESLIRKNPFDMSKIFNFESGGTVFSRVDGLTRGDGMVGFALNALKEAYYGEQTCRLMLLRYETLAVHPKNALDAVYRFINEPTYAHDFNNVVFAADEFDQRLGTPGLHHVRRRVEYKKLACVLPPELFWRFNEDNFWDRAAVNIHNVVIV